MAALVDPADSTSKNEWVCPICSVEVSRTHTYCQVCLFARPMDKRGFPQIFAGYKMHFNGIIPRTIKHPSHSLEWRMAERHGAKCLQNFDIEEVNLLVYRPGYERSDKVRRAVLDNRCNISVVPITWMLDCLLQSRQIHPSYYRLTSIPAVAQPTVKGTSLPHHQHPYFVINMKEYAIPTSFPQERVAQNGSAKFQNKMETGTEAEMNLPPFFEVPVPQYTNVDIFQTVLEMKKKPADVVEGGENFEEAGETQRCGANIGLFLSEVRQNRVDDLLFSGIRFFLTPLLEADARVRHALRACGGKIIRSDQGDIKKLLGTTVTHVLYGHGEKKSDVMIEAAYAKRHVPGLTLAQVNWAEDCLMLGELVPPCGPYVPTQKLMNTLLKKFERRENLK